MKGINRTPTGNGGVLSTGDVTVGLWRHESQINLYANHVMGPLQERKIFFCSYSNKH
jgi:hypothetical protein